MKRRNFLGTILAGTIGLIARKDDNKYYKVQYVNRNKDKDNKKQYDVEVVQCSGVIPFYKFQPKELI